MRYKKHFFMTVTGIAGCTALMLTGFGLRDSMSSIALTQFDQIMKYDLRIELGDSLELLDEPIRTLIGKEYLAVRSENGYALAGNERISTLVYIPEKSAELEKYIRLWDRRARKAAEFGWRSVVMTEKMADALGLKAGASFVLENAQGKRGEVTLTGITENYVGNYLYMDPAAYGDIFGDVPSYNTLLVHTNMAEQKLSPAVLLKEQDELIASLLQNDAVSGAEFLSHVQRSFTRLLSSIGLVVMVLIAAAGGLAMIVLYNLTNININERSRELATLRVLGFHQSEAASYIFREIMVLSISGAALGLLLGIPLHRFVISVAENVDLMFGRNISPRSFILSALITLIFSIAVDFLMLGKIRRIKMADSMKAVD
jgi:putative ABC transport system permease protein